MLWKSIPHFEGEMQDMRSIPKTQYSQDPCMLGPDYIEWGY